MTRRPIRRRLWLRGPRPRRRGGEQPRVRRRGVTFLLSAVLGVGLALLVIHAIDASVRPVVNEMAQAKVHNAVTAIVNDAVNQTLAAEAVAYEDIVTLQTDNSGRITAMSTSSAKMNALRTDILEDILEQVDCLDTQELGIPLGNLIGFATASDLGPLLPVRVVSVAAPDADFRNVFSAAGINQTLHQIMLDVSVSIKVLVPGGTVDTQVNTQVCVAETVIVGDVPQAYLQFDGARGEPTL